MLLNPASILGSVAPEIKGVALGTNNQFRNKHGRKYSSSALHTDDSEFSR